MIYAASIGAKIVEKHFTLSHDYSDFRDHKLSATPGEMAELVNKIRNIYTIKVLDILKLQKKKLKTKFNLEDL